MAPRLSATSPRSAKEEPATVAPLEASGIALHVADPGSQVCHRAAPRPAPSKWLSWAHASACARSQVESEAAATLTVTVQMAEAPVATPRGTRKVGLNLTRDNVVTGFDPVRCRSPAVLAPAAGGGGPALPRSVAVAWAADGEHFFEAHSVQTLGLALAATLPLATSPDPGHWP